jgi:hypothetical protein
MGILHLDEKTQVILLYIFSAFISISTIFNLFLSVDIAIINFLIMMCYFFIFINLIAFEGVDVDFEFYIIPFMVSMMIYTFGRVTHYFTIGI